MSSRVVRLAGCLTAAECYRLQLTASRKKKSYALLRRINRFQKPVHYTLNASIFSDPLIILLDDAQARGHVALPTHDDWPITAVSLALSNLQWFVRYDLRIDYPFLGWPSPYCTFTFTNHRIYDWWAITTEELANTNHCIPFVPHIIVSRFVSHIINHCILFCVVQYRPLFPVCVAHYQPLYPALCRTISTIVSRLCRTLSTIVSHIVSHINHCIPLCVAYYQPLYPIMCRTLSTIVSHFVSHNINHCIPLCAAHYRPLYPICAAHYQTL